MFTIRSNMASRSRSNKKSIDERVFPIRVRYRVPEEGLGKRMETIYNWLNHELGRSQYSENADCLPGKGDGISYYFFSLADAFRHYELMDELGLELLQVEEQGMLPPWRRKKINN